jgi:hypothetical protein
MAGEFRFDAFEIRADRLEDLRQVHGHGGILGGIAQRNARSSLNSIGAGATVSTR